MHGGYSRWASIPRPEEADARLMMQEAEKWPLFIKQSGWVILIESIA
jgi:hypothetical protein